MTARSRPGSDGRRANDRRLIVAGSAAVGLVGTVVAHVFTPASVTFGGRPTPNPPSSAASTHPGSGTASGSGTQPPGGGTGGGTSGPGAGPNTSVGAAENYGYGVMAVKVTVDGGRIVGLQVVQLQTAESYSQQLAEQVVPMLKNEVISAQSARISSVSGATYTSEAYASSVQSALDRLHA